MRYVAVGSKSRNNLAIIRQLECPNLECNLVKNDVYFLWFLGLILSFSVLRCYIPNNEVSEC